MLAALLPLLPVLVLAQSAPPPASDVPRLTLVKGQAVRVNTNGVLLTGEVRSLRPDVLLLELPGGQLETVPLAALDQLEVRERHVAAAAIQGALGGGLVLGLLTTAFCAANSGSTGQCMLIGAAAGAGAGGLVGALVGATSPAWRPEYTRPGVRFPESQH